MNHKKLRSKIISLVLSAAMITSVTPVTTAFAADPVPAATTAHGYDPNVKNVYTPGDGTIYYVDSTNGDDSNDGTSQNEAFKTLAKVNEITLNPGDSILLKKGSVFDDQQLAPKGRGRADEHILIGTYGDGDQMPVINTNFKYREALLIENMEYVDITGIEVTNDDAFNQTSDVNDPNNQKNTPLQDGKKFRPLGVHILINEDADTFKGDGTNNRVYYGINLDGCYIHDVDGDENYNTNKLSGGVGIEIKYHKNTGIFPVFNGVTVQNNRIDQVERCGIKAIRLTELDQNNGNGEEVGGDGERWDGVRRVGKNQASLNYVVRNNYLSDIGGDGILVDSTKGALVENNLLHEHTMRATGANAGIWSWNAFDTVFQYNESYGGPDYNQDGCSYDSDYNSAGTIFQYNYSHDTPMGFMLIMGNNDTDIIRYNLSQNDGNVMRHIAGNSNTPSYIYNNVFYYDAANWQFVHNNSAANSTTQSIRNNWQYFNNIFYNTNQDVVSNWKIGDWENAVTGSNLVYEAGGKYSAQEIPNAIHADPKFKNPGGADDRADNETGNIWDSLAAYQLQDGSPAIGAGTYVNVIPQATQNNAAFWDHQSSRDAEQDFFGNSLYHGTPDIGIHESDAETEAVLESNASYRLYYPDGKAYLQSGENSIELNAAQAAQQIVTLIKEGTDYQFRMWDSDQGAYRYLSVEDGAPVFADTDTTVWELEDLKNGLVALKTGGKYLSVTDGKIAMGTDPQGWYLKLEEHTMSFNAGGEEIKGYSKDQAANEAEKTSGYADTYTTVKKDDLVADEVYKTAVTGESITYKFFVSDSEYNLKLNFAELETVQNRAFDILVNGEVAEERYQLVGTPEVKEIAGVYPQDGVITVTLNAAYNTEGNLTNAILNGISLDKTPMAEVETRINAGGGAADGLAADQAFEDAGSGYYGQTSAVSAADTAVPTPDAGVGTAMKSYREGENFGYRFKAAPGSYRVKMYFNEPATAASEHQFDISVNGAMVETGFTLPAKDQAVGVIAYTTAKNGLIEVALTGKDQKLAMINAIVVEPCSDLSGETNLMQEADTTMTASTQQTGKEAANGADENSATRWASSPATSGQWYQAEFEKTWLLDRVAVDWTPGAYATGYLIQVQQENSDQWQTVQTVEHALPGLNVTSFDPVEAKSIRILETSRSNPSYAISFTEMEVYGQEFTGKPAVTARTEKIKPEDASDKDYQATLGLANIYSKYSTLRLSVSFKTDEVDYKDNQLLATDALDPRGEVATEEKDGITTKTFTYGIKDQQAFSKAKDALDITLTAKSALRSPVTVSAVLVDAKGHETALPDAKIYVPDEVTALDFEALIAECEDLISKAVVGVKPGEYKQEIVDAFKAAIAAAKEVGTQDETAMKAAFIELETARDSFIAAVNTRSYVNYHKDYAVDTTANYSGGSAKVENGVLTVKATQTGEQKMPLYVDLDAPDLESGTFFLRFSVNTTGDQTIFGFKAKDGTTDDIRISSDAGNWVWDNSTTGNGWGYFANAAPALTANEEHILQIEFEKNADGSYNLTPIYDGHRMNTQSSLNFKGEAGKFGFGIRRTAKDFNIKEVYYTTAPEHTIEVTAGTGGTVSQTGNVTVFEEADKTFFITPDENCEVEKVLVDGKEVELTEDGKYTFEYILEDHTLDVTFKSTVVGDKTALTNLVAEAEKLQQDGYTADSWETFEKALQAAKDVLGIENADELTLQAAYDALQTAMDQLVKPVVYHKDYLSDRDANYSGGAKFESAAVNEDGSLVITTTGDGKDTSEGYVIDVDTPSLESGTFYTRFMVDNIDDQTMFGIRNKKGEVFYAAYDQRTGTPSAWFWEKKSDGGYGDFANSPALTADEEHEMRINYQKNADGTYQITAFYDGQELGISRSFAFDPEGIQFFFGSRRVGKTFTVKEVYFGNTTEHTLTVEVGEGGTASQTGEVVTFAGTDKDIYFTADEGYQIKSVMADGKETVLNSPYTFKDIQDDHSLKVTFEKGEEPVEKPTAPKNLTVTDVTSTTAKLTWDAVGNAEGYLVLVGDKEMKVTEATVTLTDLSPETEYAVTVKAVNEAGESDLSEKVTFTTEASDPTVEAPEAPKNVKVDDVTANTATVAWDAVDNADNYLVFIDGTQAANVKETTVQLTGLAPDTTYTITVKALNKGGASDPSEAVPFTTLPDDPVVEVPDAPKNLKVIDLLETTATVIWDAVTDAESYLVEIDGEQYSVTNPEIALEGLTEETDYTVIVKAVKGEAVSEAAEIAFTTLSSEPIDGTVNLVGSVSENGIAKPRARVTLVDEDGNEIATVTADKDGNYKFRNVPEGNYRFVIDGEEVEQTVTITEEQATAGGNVENDLDVSEPDPGPDPDPQPPFSGGGTVAPSADGWKFNGTGWWYDNGNGSYTASDWQLIEGEWYYFDANGYMATGWIFDGANWFYLNPNADGTCGRMMTGWVFDGTNWFYLNPVSDGTRGAMVTGWLFDNDYQAWFYLNPNADGTCGRMMTGWNWVDGKCYYLNPNGSLVVNGTTPDGYQVDASGAWIQ